MVSNSIDGNDEAIFALKLVYLLVKFLVIKLDSANY